MRRRLSLAAASAMLSSLVFAGGVAAGPPIGGCPTGAWWEQFTPIHPQALDLNGDGDICRLRLPADGSFTWFDNVIPER